MKLARAWAKWEIRCCTIVPNAEYLAASTDDEGSWTLARHETHFMVNGNFIEENQIIKNCGIIKHIPTTIVHGRYDVVCCYDNAWLLHQNLPDSELIVSQLSGHASAEPGTKDKLIMATKNMLQLVS